MRQGVVVTAKYHDLLVREDVILVVLSRETDMKPDGFLPDFLHGIVSHKGKECPVIISHIVDSQKNDLPCSILQVSLNQ